VQVYEINGPFFFGVADSLQSVLENVELPPKIFILCMRNVPVIDGTVFMPSMSLLRDEKNAA